MEERRSAKPRAEAGTRSSRRPGRLYLIMSLLLILIALILALTVFFRVHHITVEGNTRNPSEKILEATGIQTGDNLFFVDLDAAAERVLIQFPYLREVSIRRILPDKIHLTVTEREPVGVVESGGSLWVVDGRGKVLESFAKAQSASAPDVPRILGVDLGDVYVGGKLTPADEALDLVSPVLSVLAALRENGLQSQVDTIRINSGFEVSFDCGGKYTVQMQIPCDIGDKIGFLARGLEKLETEESGVIDLKVDKVFRFIPQSVLDLQEELAKQPVAGGEEEPEDGETEPEEGEETPEE